MIDDELLQQAFETSPIGISMIDERGRWVKSNRAFEQMLGYTAAELRERTIAEVTHPDDREASMRLVEEAFAGRCDGYQIEKRYLKKSGELLWARVTFSLAQWGADRWSLAMVEDITALVAERAKASRTAHDLGERVKELTCLHAAARVLADRRLTVEGLLASVAKLVPPAFRFPANATAQATFGSVTCSTDGFGASPHQLSSAFVTADGSRGELRVSYHDAPLQPGQPVFIAESQRLLDTLAEMLRVELNRRHAAQTESDSAERLEMALAIGEMALWEWDIVRNHSVVRSPFQAVHGTSGDSPRSPPEQGGPLGSRASRVHPDDRERLYLALKELARIGGPNEAELEYRAMRPEGGWRPVRARGYVERDEHGQGVHVLGIVSDVSMSTALEGHLREARALDAIGMMTGGVAHDFNNVLAAFLSGAQLLMLDLPEGSASRATAKRVHEAALNGAQLTRQLLAFSRKADFRPSEIDVTALVQRIAPVLVRLLGAAHRLELTPAAACVVNVDAGQLEQALLALVLNAREAMEGGGTITIAVRELPPAAQMAPLVELLVSDDGAGMRPEVTRRVFEPFFTTRVGHRGLGLSTVFGFARQSGGHVTVESVPGEGTRVRVFLPASVL